MIKLEMHVKSAKVYNFQTARLNEASIGATKKKLFFVDLTDIMYFLGRVE